MPLKIVSYPANVITEFFRDTPLLVQLFFLYYVLPDYGIVLPAFLTGALALGVQYSAYTAEVYRAGIEAVPKGQHEAAKALDFSSATPSRMSSCRRPFRASFRRSAITWSRS